MTNEELLTRGVDTIYPTTPALLEKLNRGDKLTVYLGIDPTGALLHIGHTIPLRKLAQFQQAGHNVILLIGDFTARIGDPSGKDKTRLPLTSEQVLANAKFYQEQARKILDFNHPTNPVTLRYNSEWLSQLNFVDVIKLAAHFTVQQMLERDMFERRLAAQQPISMHEFFYPLMQGYDSVAMNVDLEIGGTDQTFNMLAGRTLQREINQREKFVLTVPILADSNGVKIGKSEGNVIAITAEPNDLYGKIMALGDDVILKTFELCTNVPMTEIALMQKRLEQGDNPRDLKIQLAKTVVALYHNPSAAEGAAEQFKALFVQHAKPTSMPRRSVPGSTEALHILVALELAPSKAQAQRLFAQGAVKVNNQVVSDWRAPLVLRSGDVVRVGKRWFVELN